MTAVPAESNFSELLNKPRETLAKLSRSRRLVLHRRDDEDLMLTTRARAEQDQTVTNAFSKLFADLANNEEGMRILTDSLIPGLFAWSRYLPEDALEEFANELVAELRAGAEIENLSAVAQLIIEWQHTAEIYADPELLAILTRELKGDYGPARPPDAMGGPDEPET